MFSFGFLKNLSLSFLKEKKESPKPAEKSKVQPEKASVAAQEVKVVEPSDSFFDKAIEEEGNEKIPAEDETSGSETGKAKK